MIVGLNLMDHDNDLLISPLMGETYFAEYFISIYNLSIYLFIFVNFLFAQVRKYNSKGVKKQEEKNDSMVAVGVLLLLLNIIIQTIIQSPT